MKEAYYAGCTSPLPEDGRFTDKVPPFQFLVVGMVRSSGHAKVPYSGILG
jgi:hypothetical protein